MSWYAVAVFLGCVHAVLAGCPNTAGVVVGTIFATLAVVAIIIGVIAFVYYRRIKKGKEDVNVKEDKLRTKQGHENPSFVGDVEMGAVSKNGQPSGNKNKDFPGYVECREYESPNKGKQIATISQNGSGVPQSLFLEDGAIGRSRRVHKTGSSGSLDNSYPATDPNIIVVPLLSQDIMGLGFNVDGNMKEGIFVSKLHKRGPAHDTGLITVGDRIMNVTVSFENMVLEDAMTILSYASPYPVKLCLQRPSSSPSKASVSSTKAAGGQDADDLDINHPVYRSQSLDDLRQISKEGLLHPRRTWSEWKKAGYSLPNKPMEEGRLKKWKGKTDIVEETSESGDLQTQSSTSAFSIPDLKIDINDLRMDADEVDGRDVHLAEVEVNSEGRTTETSPERVSEPTGDIGQAEKVCSGSLDPDVSVTPKEDGDEQTSNVDKSAADAEQAATIEPSDVSLRMAVPTEKPPAIPDEEDNKQLATSDAEKTKNEAEIQNQADDGSMGDVIRDYFSNSPTLLKQFGLTAEDDKQATVGEDKKDEAEPEGQVEVREGITINTADSGKSDLAAGSPDSGFMGTRPSGDGEIQKTSVSSSSSASSGSASPSQGDEGVDIDNDAKSSPVNEKGLVFEIAPSAYGEIRKDPGPPKPETKSGPKGGLAYYVSIDEHGAPSHAIRPIAGVDLSTMDLGQPELIRPQSPTDAGLIQTPTSVNSFPPASEAGTKDENDNRPSLSTAGLKASKLTVQLDGSTDSVNSLAAAAADSVTIIKQNDIPEAFTVTLNRDDSEA